MWKHLVALGWLWFFLAYKGSASATPIEIGPFTSKLACDTARQTVLLDLYTTQCYYSQADRT